MSRSPTTFGLQLLAIALAAWGAVAILHVAALTLAMLAGVAPGATAGPPRLVLYGAWIALVVQLYRGLSLDDPAKPTS